MAVHISSKLWVVGCCVLCGDTLIHTWRGDVCACVGGEASRRRVTAHLCVWTDARKERSVDSAGRLAVSRGQQLFQLLGHFVASTMFQHLGGILQTSNINI